MPGKWKFPFLNKTKAPKGQESVTQEEIDFAQDFANTVSTLEAKLHTSDDPEEIAKPCTDEHYYVHQMRKHPDFIPELAFVPSQEEFYIYSHSSVVR